MTSDAKDLLTRLLEIDPTKRYTASEALAHPWLSIEDEFADESMSSYVRPRSSSVLLVEATFKESFNRPTPPRKTPDAHKDSTRSGHHGLGIFRYMFGGLNFEDKEKKSENKEKKPSDQNRKQPRQP